MRLIELLEKRRNECGLSYADFCRQLDIHPDHYRRLRRNEYEVGLKMARKIEVWLGDKETELNEIRAALLS